jgi:hypothetical protein
VLTLQAPGSRIWLLAGISAAAVAGLPLHGPITQDAAYHRFADQRTLLGVPNLWNVVSNVPFLLVGLLGLRLLRRGHCGGELAHLRPAYLAFFFALCLVTFGSGYYHLNPGDASLVWDRLPMTLAFMALFSAILQEHIPGRLIRGSLTTLLVFGLGSVAVWQMTGDLRAYVLVQFLPMLLIPVVMLVYRSRAPGARMMWAVLAGYVAAKLLEHFDAAIYRAIGLGGHCLKHLMAAVAVYFVVVVIDARRVGLRG